VEILLTITTFKVANFGIIHPMVIIEDISFIREIIRVPTTSMVIDFDSSFVKVAIINTSMS